MIPSDHSGTPFKQLTRTYIDFEYNGTREARFNLVCAAYATDEGHNKTVWLHNDKAERLRFKELLKSLRDTHIFVSWNVVAEASSFIALGLDPTRFAWIDLQLEYKMLTNHWNKYRYGKQLLGGKKQVTHPPLNKWESTEEERAKRNSQKPETNLAAATYKLLGKVRDTDHKTAMRDLIISAPSRFSDEERRAILSYCQEDVEDLPDIFRETLEAYRSSTAKRDIFFSELAWRGNCAARTALMSQTGYPVNREAVTKFSRSVNKILNEISEDVNEQFPEMQVFDWNKNENRYSKKEKPQREWIEASPYRDKWELTDTGRYSLSLDAYTRHFSYRHDYPRGVFPAQMIRYLKTKQSLNGFVISKSRRNFFDSYGEDGRARAWLNPYGSQSSRFQPKATGYIPLKSAWMRSLIQPPPGSSIVGIDYGSEEFLLSALISQDRKMYESYKSGDPYFHFAKLAGAVPANAERKDHEKIRTLFKATTLGISYLMGPANLALKLTEDTGEEYTEREARKLIDTFFNVYSQYNDWIERSLHDYKRRGYLKLADGWVMFGDNPNFRSVSNCPIQGFGGCILRKAIELAQKSGVKVILPLHDALYAEYINDIPQIDPLYDSMKEAFIHYFRGSEVEEWAECIRMDIDVWGPGQEDGYFQTLKGRKYKQQEIYIDPRGAREYERFKQYLS